MNARVCIDDASGIGTARRSALVCASEAGLSEQRAAAVGLIVTELATNIVRHAGSGSLLVQRVASPLGDAVEIQAVDGGPGIEDTVRCLRDGYSSRGTAGTGLGAAKRFADEFDLYATPSGTVVVARVFVREGAKQMQPASACPVAWGYTMQAAPRETCNGDALAVATNTDVIGALVADGLGHGPQAARASNLAASLFGSPWLHDLPGYVEHAHGALASTRGAALAACRLDVRHGRLAWLGVGNIAGTLLTTAGSRRLLSHNGTVGQPGIRIRPIDYDCVDAGLLVMHSDGIRSNWNLDPYPGLEHRHPALIAATLARDFRRGNDDSTLLVVRFPAASTTTGAAHA